MTESRNVNFRWSPEFIASIDKARGLVPRSAYVRRALEEKMKREGLVQHIRDRMPNVPAAYLDSTVPTSGEVLRLRATERAAGRLGKGPVKPRPKTSK